MTENITTYLIIVLCVNLFLFAGQLAVNDINPDPLSRPTFFSATGSIYSSIDAGNYTLYADASDYLPTGVNSVSPESGTTYTDDFSTASSWLIEKTGVGYILGMLSAPYNFLKALNLPDAFVFMLGTLWYGITLFLLVGFLLGRQT
jgi:hypothetical protein